EELLDLDLALAGGLGGDPAGGGVLDALVVGVDVVLALEAVLHDLELELADGADDEVAADERLEDLDRALLGELLEALGEGLGLEGALEEDAAEELGGEAGDAGEAQELAGGEGVADLDGAVVGDPDDVAGVGGLDDLAVAGHEHGGVAEAD